MRSRSVADLFSDYKSEALRRRHVYEKACAKDAALVAVKQEISGFALKKMRCALNGTTDEACDAALAALARKEAQITAQIIEKPYACAFCHDTGMVDGEYCVCLLDKIYTQYYGAVDIAMSNISFETFDPSVFDDEERLFCGKTQRQLMEMCARIVQKHLEAFPATKTSNMLLRGKAGLGKSYLLYCMAKQAKRKGIDVLLIRANELFGLFFAHRMGEETDLSYLYGTKLLLVDDVGTEPITQNVSIEYFYELIAKRMAAGLHTVFATNVDDLQKRYDDRIASRLESKQDCTQLLFEGKDLRVN